jgi:hypothetical protein
MPNHLDDLLQKLSLQASNIMSDNPSKAELEAIKDQTKQLVAVSKPMIDIYQLKLDSCKVEYMAGRAFETPTDILEVGNNHKARQVGYGAK